MTKLPNQSVFRAKAAAAYLDVSESTIWRWAKEGKLPKGLPLSARVTVWKKEWLDSKLEEAEIQSQ